MLATQFQLQILDPFLQPSVLCKRIVVRSYAKVSLLDPGLPTSPLCKGNIHFYFNQHRAYLGSFSRAFIKNRPCLSQSSVNLLLTEMCFEQFKDLHHYSKQKRVGAA